MNRSRKLICAVLLILTAALILSGFADAHGHSPSPAQEAPAGAGQLLYHITNIVFIFAACIWAGLSVLRILNAYIRRIFLATCFLIIGWSLLQYFACQLNAASPFSRYCQYGFCFFQLALPLFLLWLSLALDNTHERRYTRSLQLAALLLYGTLALLVMSNDLHMLLFSFTPSDPLWYAHCARGPLYFVVFAAALVPLAASFVVVILKAAKGPRLPAILLPLALGAFLILYAFADAFGPKMMQFDHMMPVVSIIVLLYLETAMRTGLIPVNRRYRMLFALSPLKMQIVNADGERILGSAACVPVDRQVWDRIRQFSGAPILQDTDTLLYTDPIPGGAVIWQEDISELNRLEQASRENVLRLRTANELLSRERETRAQRAAAEEKLRLMTSLEEEIRTRMNRLSDLIRIFPEQEDKRLAIGRITMLLCCIKRRCSLFFRERETLHIPADELAVYLDELSEFSEYAGVRLITSCSMTGDLPARQATIIYDFFYAVLAACTRIGNASILTHLREETNGFTLMMLPSVLLSDAQVFDEALRLAIAQAQGVAHVKVIDDDTIGFSLSFRKGGVPHA